MMHFRSLLPLAVASLLAVQGSSQYVDLFQGLQNLFQPYQYENYREVTTRRTETRRQGDRQKNNINPTIIFPDDPRSKPTTAKPRKSRPSTARPSKVNVQDKVKNDRKQNLNENIYFIDDRQKEKHTPRNPDVSNKRPGNRLNQALTTRRPLSRPGVKPAPVDESRPPITNRPVDFGYPETSDGPELEIGPDEDDMTSVEKRQYEEVADEMCERYKALNVKKVVALPLVPSPQGVEFNVSDCTPINIPLIIGGTVSKIEEFPHMSLVGWKKVQGKGYSWKCGGSLISDQYVLTAGHCTYHDKDSNVVSGPPHAVQLGSTYVDGPGAVVVKTARVIRHPKYKLRRSYFDVALINLASRVSFSDVIRPACVGTPPPVGRPIIATGWGRTEFGGTQSLELRSVSLPIWDMQDCRQVWGTSLKLPNGPTSESHVCAGERSGGKDTCQGDSGGPAQIQDGCAWRVVAVTSSGRSCGAPDTPALYATIPKAFVAAEIYGKKALQNKFNQNNANRQTGIQNNRDIHEQKINSQSLNSKNNHNQNNRGTNSQIGNYNQNNRDNNINSQNNWNSASENYNQNSYQNNRDVYSQSGNHNQNNQNNYQNNQNWNIQNQNKNTNQYNQNSQSYVNRDTYQTTAAYQNSYENNYSQNNYNRDYQNNRNSYVTESWSPAYTSGYDSAGYGVTERPWYR